MSRILCLIFFFLCFSGKAQVFFKCSKPGSDSAIWVFAPISGVPADRFQIDPLLDSVVSISEKLFFAAAGLETPLTESKPLKEVIGKKYYRRLTKYYQQHYSIRKTRLAEYSHLNPKLMHRALMNDSIHLTDPAEEIRKIVKNAGKEILSFDDAFSLREYQLSVSAGYDADWLMAYLDSMSGPAGRKIEEVTKQVNYLVRDALLRQDQARLNSLINRTSPVGQEIGKLAEVDHVVFQYSVNELPPPVFNKKGLTSILANPSKHILLIAEYSRVTVEDGLLKEISRLGYIVRPIMLRIDIWDEALHR